MVAWLALDFEPQNRLEAAKQVIDAFIGERRYDRTGLGVFSREAYSQCPPTFDYKELAGWALFPALGLLLLDLILCHTFFRTLP